MASHRQAGQASDLSSPVAMPVSTTTGRPGSAGRRRRRYHGGVRTPIFCSLALAALAALLLPACQSCSDKRPATGDTAGTGDQGSDIETRKLETVRLKNPPRGSATAVDLPAPRVRSFELLAPGKAPRQALRYGAEAGERLLTVAVRVDTHEYADEKWTPWGTLPEIRYGLALGREAGQPALTVRGLDVEIGQPAAAAPDVAAYVTRVTEEMTQRYRSQVQGHRASATIDARGLIALVEPTAGSEPAPGPHTRREMLQILAESVVPLPEEPVGVGARWQVTMLLGRGAAMVNQVATYELLGVEKSGTWRIRATLAQDGEHQMVTAPELPAGVTAELVALVWRAEGELQVSPSALTPLAGKLAVEYRVHSRLDGGRRRQEFLLDSKGEIELTTRAP
jgi:hypothetical protein